MMGLDYHSAYYQGCLAHHEMTGFQPFGHNEISARFNRGLPHEAICPVYENGIVSNGTLLPGQLILKVLIPGYAAGAVIGKHGQIITQLQRSSNANVKLSKPNDFYPGTEDRVGLIQGTAEGLMKVQNAIIEKVYDFPVPKDLSIGDRPKQVKIIVPNTTAGLVIGKAGATIRMIMEESGAKVQLSQKPGGVNVQERVITIKGEKNQLITASNIIIDKIKDDPQSASCPYISYSGVIGPVANANPTGSPYAAGSTALIEPAANIATMLPYIFPGHQQVVQAASIPYLQPASGTTTPAPTADLSQFNPPAFGNYSYCIVPNIQGIQTITGASNGMIPMPGSVSPIPSATPLLSATSFTPESNTLSTGLPTRTLSIPNGYITTSGAAYLTSGQQQLVSATPPANFSTLAAYQHPPAISSPSTFSIASAPATPSLATSHFQHNGSSVMVLRAETSNDGHHASIDLSVPETLIGAILGKSGRTLHEYQSITGAKIQISKKGDYIQGTRNRRVSITGRAPSTRKAQTLITERITSTQTARAQQLKFI